MRILLTNDDGIGAQGLQTLRRHLREIDGITLDVIAGSPRSLQGPALSNSFGFGGHNATLVVGPPPS